jgi:anti-anti-sigma factor
MVERDRPNAHGTTRAAGGDLARVRFQDRDGITVAAISGEVDVSNADQIADALAERPAAARALVVDLCELVYLDSTGVALLHELAVSRRQRAQRLIVVCPPDSPPRRVLELTAFDSHTLIVDQLRSAIQALRYPST